jgi:hypothetical protein
LLAAALLVAGCRAPAPVAARAGEIVVTRPYAFAPVIGDEGSAYFSLRNEGKTADTLVNVRAGSGVAMLHGSQTTSGVTRMVMLQSLPLPAHTSVALAIGQTHLMLTGLNPVPHPGDTIQLTLTFARGGTASVAVPVYKYGQGPGQ